MIECIMQYETSQLGYFIIEMVSGKYKIFDLFLSMMEFIKSDKGTDKLSFENYVYGFLHRCYCLGLLSVFFFIWGLLSVRLITGRGALLSCYHIKTRCLLPAELLLLH